MKSTYLNILLLLCVMVLVRCSSRADFDFVPERVAEVVLSDETVFNFGTVYLDGTSNQTIQFLNHGRADALLSTPSFSGEGFGFIDGSFPGSGGTCSSSSALIAGSSCEVALEFAPTTQSGTLSSTLDMDYIYRGRTIRSTVTVTGTAVSATPFSLDTQTWGGTGLTLNADYPEGSVLSAIAIQSDRKIIVVGRVVQGGVNDMYIARYLPTGGLDTSFGDDGEIIQSLGASDDVAYAVKILSDGKILVGGGSNQGGTRQFALLRYDTDGQLDSSFGTEGVVLTTIGSGTGTTDIQKIHVYADGKILAGGNCVNVGKDVCLARYASDGTLDTSFDTDGKVTHSYLGVGGALNEALRDMGVDGEGRIYVLVSTAALIVIQGHCFRLTSAGAIDTDWSGDGTLQITVTGSGLDSAYGMLIDDDGNVYFILVYFIGAGDFGTAIIRTNDAGVFDATWGSGTGKVLVAPKADLFLVTSAPHVFRWTEDGRFLIAGEFAEDTVTNYGFSTRLNSDGSLDTTYGTNGFLNNQFSDADEHFVNDLAIQDNGKIIFVGATRQGGIDAMTMARFW